MILALAKEETQCLDQIEFYSVVIDSVSREATFSPNPFRLRFVKTAIKVCAQFSLHDLAK